MADSVRPSSAPLRYGAGSLVLALCVALGTAAISQVPAGAGGPAPDKTIPTLPPSSGDVPDTSTDTSVSVSTEPVAPSSTEAAVESGIPLRAGAGPAELFAAATQAVQSPDVAAGLGRLAVIPAGIPTPAGATMSRVSVSYSAPLEYYIAAAEFTTPATADDVATYYQTVLTAEGFALTLDHADADIRQLDFARETAESESAVVRLSIDSRDEVTVDLEVTDHAGPEALQAFTGWAAGLPGLDDGQPTDARLSATSDGATAMSTTWVFEGVTIDELTGRVRDGLANGGGGFRIADSDEGGATITLERTGWADAVASITEVDGGAELRVDGSID